MSPTRCCKRDVPDKDFDGDYIKVSEKIPFKIPFELNLRRKKVVLKTTYSHLPVIHFQHLFEEELFAWLARLSAFVCLTGSIRMAHLVVHEECGLVEVVLVSHAIFSYIASFCASHIFSRI